MRHYIQNVSWNNINSKKVSIKLKYNIICKSLQVSTPVAVCKRDTNVNQTNSLARLKITALGKMHLETTKSSNNELVLTDYVYKLILLQQLFLDELPELFFNLN